MFAFALWDRNRETLFLARDRLGVKPLHYALLPDGTVLFGSELKSILAHGGIARDIDPRAIEEYFALGYVAEPRTIFAAREEAAAGAHPHAASGRNRARAASSTGTSASRSTTAITARDAEARARRAAARVGPAAHDFRSSARRVPVGRRRLERGRRDDGRAVRGSRSTRARSPSRIRPSTSLHSPAIVAERYHTNHHVDRVESDDFDLIDTLAPAVRRALRRQLGDPDLSRLPARAQARHRCACPATAATRASAATGAIGCT